MAESVRERFSRWRLEELLRRYPGLRIIPIKDDELILSGKVAFRLQGPDHGPIEDAYTIEIRVPPDFPERVPTAEEVSGRIPEEFHKLDANRLCLASPTELRLKLALSPTLLTFVEKFVIPYLFSFSYFTQHGMMPFGELEHGSKGIYQYLGDLFDAPAHPGIEQFVLLAAMKKRLANKQPCPCRSGRRLGRCHHRRINRLRDRLGRGWFQQEYTRIASHLGHLFSLNRGSKLSENAAEAAKNNRNRLRVGATAKKQTG